MFLYLVPATGPLVWVDIQGLRLAEALQHAPDLAGLLWQPTDLTRTWDDVRVAIRHGEPVSAGLVVEGLKLTDLRREDELRMLNTASRTIGEELTESDEFMESLIPGWKDHGDKLDNDIDESVEAHALEHRERVEELLSAPPQAHLVDHWMDLGGLLPDPL